jgi:hypothetical protein
MPKDSRTQQFFVMSQAFQLRPRFGISLSYSCFRQGPR